MKLIVMTKKFSKIESDCKLFIEECSKHGHKPPSGAQEYLHNELAFKITQSGNFGGNWLVELFLNSNVPCSSVICALPTVQEPILEKNRHKIKERLGDLVFKSHEAKIRAQSIYALCSLKITDYDILPFVEGEDAYVSVSAIHYLGVLDPIKSIDLFKQLLNSTDPLILQSVLDEFDQPCFVEYFPLVQNFVNHKNSDVRAAATATLEGLFDYRGNDSALD